MARNLPSALDRRGGFNQGATDGVLALDLQEENEESGGKVVGPVGAVGSGYGLHSCNLTLFV